MSTVCKKVNQKQKPNRKLNGTQSLTCIQKVYIGTKHIYAFSATSDTVLGSFQYEILHHILPTITIYLYVN